MGYRTSRSVKNQSTWDFAQRVCARNSMKMFFPTTILAVVIMPFCQNKDNDIIGWIGLGVTLAQLISYGIILLKKFGLNVIFMEHARKGLSYISEHPDKRAEDLIQAFKDDSIDMILCAIGGDDTYRLLPYLFDNDELKNAVNQKIFLGFSDTTMNHLMLHKLGIKTFYGQSFLADICELEKDMLPYTEKYFLELIRTGKISKIEPSDVWYEERKDFSIDAIGTKRIMHDDTGFRLLQGNAVFKGEILGGCIESIYDIFDNGYHSDSVEMCQKYELFPNIDDWKDKILLIESSEEKATPDKYRKMIKAIKDTGIFDVISGVLVGKPMDNVFAEEYGQILVEVIDNPKLPIVCNVNIGHAIPRAIIPFGVKATVDTYRQVIEFDV